MSTIARNNVHVLGRSGAPMVFAHGFGCDQNMWRLVAPQFTDTFRVVLFDHVGAGNSDLSAWSPEKYRSLKGYADDLIEILHELSLGQAVFVGHSVSAMIGVMAARAAPELFSHLVLVGPSPRYINEGDYVGGFSAAQIEELLDFLDHNHMGWSAAMAPVIMGNTDRPDLSEELTNSFCRTDPEIARHFARTTFMSDNRADLEHVTTPTLILQCREDIIAPLAVGEYVHRAIPFSQLITLDATGHCPNLSAPVETAAAIRKFLMTDMGSSQDLLSPKVQFGIEELEDLYEHAPCGYLSLAPDGRIGRVNTTFLAWTGHSQRDLLGRKFQDLLNIAGKIYYETHFAPMLRMQGFFNEVALDLVAKHGNPIPVFVNAVEKRDVDQKPTFVRVTVFNATERRRYERELLAARNALATANQELRAFYETLPVGIFRADASGEIVQASRRFCALFGILSAEEWLSAVAADDRSVAELQMQRAIRNGEPFSSRFRVAGGDATLRHIEMNAVPIPGTGDNTSTLVGVVKDVTEQVHADARKQEMDRQSAISQITGGLAHNLNNILSVIMGNLEILEDESADLPALRPILRDSFGATERAAVLVSRLMVYSGYSAAQPSTLSIDPCLQEIARELAAQFGQHHRLTCDLHAPGAVVELDAGMLKEAVGELIANAVAALPSGGGILLSTRRATQDVPSDRPKVVVMVRDHGVGMEEALLAKACEPFFTTREVGQGVGLGLSLVEGVSRIAGGELRLRSHPGTGTTVEMLLPVKN